MLSNKLRKRLNNIRSNPASPDASPTPYSPPLSLETTDLYSNKYTDLPDRSPDVRTANDNAVFQSPNIDNSPSPFASPRFGTEGHIVSPEANSNTIPSSTESHGRTLKHKTSKLFKRTTSMTLEGITSTTDKLKMRNNNSISKVQISGPQNFKHLYHMDTTANDSDKMHSPDDMQQPAPPSSQKAGYKPSPASMSSSLFSDDYIQSGQYPATPSSPVSSATPATGDRRVSDRPNININTKNVSYYTSKTSPTNSASSIFDKNSHTHRNLRTSSSFSTTTGNSSDQKLGISQPIRETNADHGSSKTSNSYDSIDSSRIGNFEFSSPFNDTDTNEKNKSTLSYRSRQNSTSSLLSNTSNISSHSRRLLVSDSKLQYESPSAALSPQGAFLKHNKFLNDSTPVPNFAPPAPPVPASPAHTNRSEDSSKTVIPPKTDDPETSISPITGGVAYKAPKLDDFISDSSVPNSLHGEGSTFSGDNSSGGLFNSAGTPNESLSAINSVINLASSSMSSSIQVNNIQPPPARPQPRKSKSFKNLKKSLNKHIQSVALPRKIGFKQSNDSVNSLGSDKSLTGFSPEEDTNNAHSKHISLDSNAMAETSTILKHLSFEQGIKSSFDIDFDKEVNFRDGDASNTDKQSMRSSSHQRQQSSFSSGVRSPSNIANMHSYADEVHRSRHGTITSTTTSNSSSGFSYNTTKPVPVPTGSASSSIHVAGSNNPSPSKDPSKEKRRSTVYIRQSWLKDEALAIYKDGDIGRQLAILNGSPILNTTGEFSQANHSNENTLQNITRSRANSTLRSTVGDILEEDETSPKRSLATEESLVRPFVGGASMNSTFDDSYNGTIVESTDSGDKIRGEIEDNEAIPFEATTDHEVQGTASGFMFSRRRSETDLTNIAMLELEEKPIESELDETTKETPEETFQFPQHQESSPVKELSVDTSFAKNTAEASSGPAIEFASKGKSMADLKRLTLHTPSYILKDKSPLSKSAKNNQEADELDDLPSPTLPIPDDDKRTSPTNTSFNPPSLSTMALESPSNSPTANQISFVYSKNLNLPTPKKFGHNRNISVASSIYSNGTGGLSVPNAGDINNSSHSRSSSMYNNEALVASADDLLVNKSRIENGSSLNGNTLELDSVPPVVPLGIGKGKKKLTVDRNSYIQFNFNKFEDFKAHFNEVEE
ncbi:hypothetical protein DASC09_049590 [Saccharomycopsis crataegensis]|uniref:CRIB domain-containing protein n=1 Tax=Saccharomycopsis crataegensis TaxID=43959 RepID=A0AAV5QT12_9ASCO|nr:hypothetical protein DASC09_049590 [Saccharomycopsis crataegensis]